MIEHSHEHAHMYEHEHQHAHAEGHSMDHDHEHGPGDHPLTHMAVEAHPAGAGPAVAGEESRYPWGLRLTLGHAELEKLGVKDLPAAGESLDFEARAKVVGSRKEAGEGEKGRSLDLHITHMDFVHDQKAEKKEEEEGDGFTHRRENP